MNIPQKRVLLAITGASGSILAQRCMEVILPKVDRLYLLATESGFSVCEFELTRKGKELNLVDCLNGDIPDVHKDKIRILNNKDFYSPVASGSSCPQAMIVLPCSMGTLARICHGYSSNLLERAADVVLKQGGQLVICPRESPLNKIHLKNMYELAQMGAHIVPPVPAFYQKPKSIEDLVDFCVGKVLEIINIEHQLYSPWNKRMI